MRNTSGQTLREGECPKRGVPKTKIRDAEDCSLLLNRQALPSERLGLRVSFLSWSCHSRRAPPGVSSGSEYHHEATPCQLTALNLSYNDVTFWSRELRMRGATSAMVGCSSSGTLMLFGPQPTRRLVFNPFWIFEFRVPEVAEPMLLQKAGLSVF